MSLPSTLTPQTHSAQVRYFVRHHNDATFENINKMFISLYQASILHLLYWTDVCRLISEIILVF